MSSNQIVTTMPSEGIDGIKITEEQAKELEVKSADTWHWREVDLREWARERIQVLFKGKQLIDTATVKVELFKTEVYGEAFATSRKGQTEATCNLDCRIYWRGKLLFNGGIVGTAVGTIKFPEVVANTSVDELTMHILADGEDPSAMRMLNPCSSIEETQLRPLESYELKLREAVQTCEGEIRGLMAKLIQDMIAYAAGETVQEPSHDKEEDAEVSTEISDKIRAEVEGKMENMRLQALPEKFAEAIAKIEANEVERVELSVCRITDAEVVQLVAALKDDTNVKSLNISFNQITDVGIQTLVTGIAMGAAKGLTELNVCNNPFAEMGVRMLGGVEMMRKGLKVVSESSIGN